MEELFWNYTKRLDILDEHLDDDFSDLAFAYDYNEVQELFFAAERNDFVILAGRSGLRKKDMLARVCHDLYAYGVEKSEILYFDFELPILHGENILSLISEAVSGGAHYVIINELQEVGDWHGLLVQLREKFPRLKLIAASSVPHLIHETLYDEPLDFCKIIVLSQKNGSNIKYRSEGFGVFGEFKYNIKDGYVEIKGLTKRGKGLSHHEIPSEIEGFPVKVIASGAFHDRAELKSIVIPEGIELIGDYAFSKCASLTQIHLPTTLKYIGDHAFLGASQLNAITGGANVEHIGNSALYATPWLHEQREFSVIGKTLYRYLGSEKNVCIPKEILFASAFCFVDSAVERVTAQSSISLSEGMFYRCTSLEKVDISFSEIPPFAFYGCTKLRLTGRLDRIGRFALYDCKNVGTVSTSHIGACGLAFSSVEEVTDVQELGRGALYGCEKLHKLKIEDGGEVGRFSVCGTRLDTIKLHEGNVGDYAFYNNLQLSLVDMISAVLVGRGVLYGCEHLTEMRVSGLSPLSAWFAPQEPPVRQICVEGDIVDNFCRNNINIEKVKLVDVKRFGRWSFYGNTNLKDLTLQNVQCIGDWAFAYCSGLQSVVLPPEVSYIGMNAFRYCRNLKDITLLASAVVPFGPNAFYSTAEQKQFCLPACMLAAYSTSEIWREYLHTSKVTFFE